MKMSQSQCLLGQGSCTHRDFHALDTLRGEPPTALEVREGDGGNAFLKNVPEVARKGERAYQSEGKASIRRNSVCKGPETHLEEEEQFL